MRAPQIVCVRPTNMPPQINSGDRVVELAALVVTAAVTAGSIAGAWIMWLIKKNWAASIGAIFIGAVLGFATARVLANIIYRSPNGDTVVVKIGSASLSSTIPAGLIGGIAAGVVMALGAMLVFGAGSQAASLFGVAVGCGIVLGILFACLGSLT